MNTFETYAVVRHVATGFLTSLVGAWARPGDLDVTDRSVVIEVLARPSALFPDGAPFDLVVDRDQFETAVSAASIEHLDVRIAAEACVPIDLDKAAAALRSAFATASTRTAICERAGLRSNSFGWPVADAETAARLADLGCPAVVVVR